MDFRHKLEIQGIKRNKILVKVIKRFRNFR